MTISELKLIIKEVISQYRIGTPKNDEFSDLPISPSMKTKLRRKKLGLCPNCGSDEQTGGKVCNSCIEKIREKEREKHKKRIEQGLCKFCENPLDTPFGYCSKCREKAIERYKEKHKNDIRKSPGRKPIKDKFSDLPVSRKRKWQLRMREQNRCKICGEPAINSQYCEKHQKQRVKRNKIKDLLRKKFERQISKYLKLKEDKKSS